MDFLYFLLFFYAISACKCKVAHATGNFDVLTDSGEEQEQYLEGQSDGLPEADFLEKKFLKKQNEHIDSAFKKNIVGNILCNSNNFYDPCNVCVRSCMPYAAVSTAPCQCSNAIGKNYPDQMYNAFSQPPLMGEIVKSPAYSAMETNDFVGGNNFNVEMCKRTCMPNMVSSFAPCQCANAVNMQMASPYGVSAYPQPILSSGFMNMNMNLKESKCKKSCAPYPILPVSNIEPCRCDYTGINLNQNFLMAEPSQRSDFDPVYNPYAMYGNNMYDSPFAFMLMSNNEPNPNIEQPKPKSEEPLLQVPKKKNYKLQGCFKDKRLPGRDLKINIPISKLTIDKCVDKCTDKGKRFAGLQYGYLCFCGSRFGRYGKSKKNPDDCSIPCVGDPSQNCGGAWYNSVYSTDGQFYSSDQFNFNKNDPADEEKADKTSKKTATKKKTELTENKLINKLNKNKTDSVESEEEIKYDVKKLSKADEPKEIPEKHEEDVDIDTQTDDDTPKTEENNETEKDENETETEKDENDNSETEKDAEK